MCLLLTQTTNTNQLPYDLFIFFLHILIIIIILRLIYTYIPEYCCQLWNPWKAKDIQAIEAIQRTFTYKITEVQH